MNKTHRLRMNKKAQGLSLNVIIIAIIALLVLVILALIFTGRMSIFNKNAGDCAVLGGECKRSDCSGSNERQVGYNCNLDGDDNINEGKSVDGVCCLSI